jgi:hypothetical protein
VVTVTCSCRFTFYTLLLRDHFVLTQTICQAEIPVLLDSLVANTPSVKMLYPKQNCFSLYFRKSITCLSACLLRICQVFSISYKNCLLARYNRLLFHEWCTTEHSLLCSIQWLFASAWLSFRCLLAKIVVSPLAAKVLEHKNTTN